MLTLVVFAILGLVVLVISTDQFVQGASTVATGLRMSSVLVGAVILGCGTGLPELALAFHRAHVNPLRDLLGLEHSGSTNLGLLIFLTVLVIILSIPALLPHVMTRHSPTILACTIMFAALLRGSLDIYEGTAMLAGFVVGIAWIIRNERSDVYDPFAPVIEDSYDSHGVYIEAPVMTPVQVGATRCMLGLVGTAIGTQLLARSAQHILHDLGYGVAVTGLVFIALGSVLPHVVVAVQALKQHHKGLAVGNLIGSNLFQSLAIGGLVAIIRPYQEGGSIGLKSIGIVGATALLTWMLLHTEDELSRKQGAALLAAYVALVALTVP